MLRWTVQRRLEGGPNARQQTKVDFDYDQYGNVVNKREYGYQIGGVWQVRRRTQYTYITWEPYISSYMRNRVTEIDVFDALQNTYDSDDVLIGKSVYGYDNPMGGMEGYGGAANPPGRLSSYDTTRTARGNLTNATVYSDVGTGTSVTHSSKVDIFGGVTKAQVDCCNQKSFTMTEATYWSRSSQTTTGDISGIYLTSSAGYDFNTLVAISQTNPDNQTSTYSYDAWGNPTGFTAPTGANGGTSYNAWSEPTSSTVTYSDGGVNKTITTSSVYDAWGQMTQSVDANGAQTNCTYNNMGRRLTQTNPFPQGGTPGPVTTYQYDQLGRVIVVTLPDGNTIQTSYSGTVVTATDQVGRKIKRESDGLGRLIKVTEQDVSTGALTQETTYTYDIADHLIGVNQGGQTRASKYDSAGRLLFERIPEMPALVNDGTGTMWSCKYTYTSFGAVATKTDGRGVVITYGYDSLNRLTSISYNTSGAPSVVSTPNVTYTYDTNQSSSTNGLLLSLSAGGYSESYGYDSFNRVASLTRTIDGRNYTSSYQYNTANQAPQITYPSGRVINLGRDSKGRVTSVGSYLTSVTYNNIGQLTGTSLGNGVSESYGYDANRMQLTTQTATKSGGPTGGLMNLTYAYQASAGQMGAGSTTGNASQLIAINNSSTINGAAESAAYTYDNLGRLVTSNQTSNAVSAARRFAYDRWGNRTGMWDAVSGGNQLQNIVIDGANHIWSVNSSTSDPNYYYDPAGNLVWAGGHSYNYDAENRLVCVDGCATAQYAYDPSNRRYKKVTGGATTHYIWEGSQVIAEYDGSSGTLTAEYIYSGSRMIAKIAGGTTQYFLNDRLSVRLVLDASGNVLGRQAHLPFGEDFAESGAQDKHRFTSYERDSESGTDYAVNRGYSSAVGKFLQADPYRANSYVVDPESWNRCSYGRNDPVDNIDPQGMDWIGVGSAISDAFFSGVVYLYAVAAYPSSPSSGRHPPPGQLVDSDEIPGVSGGGEPGKKKLTASDCDSALAELRNWVLSEKNTMGVILNALNGISEAGNNLVHAIGRELEQYINRVPAPRDLPALRRQFLQWGLDAAGIFSSTYSKDQMGELWSLAEKGSMNAGDIANAAQAASINCAKVRDFKGNEEFKNLAAQALSISQIYGPFFTGLLRGGGRST